MGNYDIGKLPFWLTENAKAFTVKKTMVVLTKFDYLNRSS